MQWAAISGRMRCIGAARQAVANTRPTRPFEKATARRQLLVDVSIVAGHDAGTGIQQTVRALLKELLLAPPPGFDVRPIRATRKSTYQYAYDYAASFGVDLEHSSKSTVQARHGDIFLGLDLNSRIAPSRQRDFLTWQAQGVRFAFIVYDLLPALHPEWFTPRARQSFQRWLRTISVHSDALFCISRAVAADMRAWLHQNVGIEESTLPANWFHLGTNTMPSPVDAAYLDAPLQNKTENSLRRCALMVGTIEPRKGHAQVLDAFERLWLQGRDNALIIVGREGWHVDALVERLRHHPEAGRRLIWLNNVQDKYLNTLYSVLGGLIMASEAEGFGLPLVEAGHHGMPIFARDLPVFKEVAGPHAQYFSGNTGTELAPQIDAWLDLLETGRAPRSQDLQAFTWQASSTQLKTLLAEIA
ncbi:glycosyltransferase family 4 protein [Paraburkholderia acidicola]|uniref:glycosyltransferase family 4 protein n=1 Tax=Paraburkholderia acidicola TaxID=1912599 RepID=UPI001A961A2F|nr:glycosyltransferase family 1 protein [Paraburkholderia acidicola]